MDIREKISRLTLEEKAMLLQGCTTWTTHAMEHADIPSIFLSDGPHGMRRQVGSADHLGIGESVPATCFPTAATMASSWNTELGERLGKALGKEAAACDVQVVLGPGLNIKRSPLCGRNFEYFSEDPYLAGKMAAAYIRGIQSEGVAACPKHFAVNSQEEMRLSTDSVVDERTLREIYLTGFEIAVKEGGAKAIMSSYNNINGIYANENLHLLTEILRGEWSFDGFVVTDWGADNDHVEGVRAGSDLVMPAPGHSCAVGLIRAVREGRIDESVIDRRLEELLGVACPLAERARSRRESFDAMAHHRLARKCAEESIVLLDNDGILPLAVGDEVAVIGSFARVPRYQGAGSSQVNPTRVDNLYDSMLAAGLRITGYADGYDRKSTEPSAELIDEAVRLAEGAGTVILAVGLEELLESEGADRTHMELSASQAALIEAVSAVNKNVILVLSGGAPFVMPARSCYRAAIHGYLGGQAGAAAMADALIGRVNPSGRLSESWPNALEDTPCYNYYPGKERTAEYREGLFVGYRYYGTAGVGVRYPFGHGLSYTSFEYSDLSVTDDGASFTVTNTGECDGAEVVQLYISKRDGAVYRPERELKGFTKLHLASGESRRVTIPFDDKTFRYFDTGVGNWQIEGGEYEVIIARNASDSGLRATVAKSGTAPSAVYPDCYRTGRVSNVSDEDFSTMLGHDIPEAKWGGELTRNDPLCRLCDSRSRLGRWLYKLLSGKKRKAEKRGDTDLTVVFIYNMPFRTIGKMSHGWVSERMVDDVVTIFNGHFFRGFGRLIADFFRNLSDKRKLKRALKKRCNMK